MAQPGPAVPPSDLDERTAASAPGPAPPADTLARDGTPAPTVGFAQHVVAVGVATILAGLFLAIAPFLLDYVSDAAAINAIACGALAIFLGVLRFAGVRHPAVGYVQVALGIWLVVASVLFGELAREAWIARSIGVMIFFLGLLGLARMERDPAV
jgi:tetrahydromethanopterin S-methyltransferase subunit C